MEHHMEHGTGGGFGLLPALMGATWAVLLAALMVGALYLLHRRGMLPTQRVTALAAAPTRGGRNEAEQFLDMALAKGEISVDEYFERRSALRNADL